MPHGAALERSDPTPRPCRGCSAPRGSPAHLLAWPEPPFSICLRPSCLLEAKLLPELFFHLPAREGETIPQTPGSCRAAGPCRGSVVLSHPHPSTLEFWASCAWQSFSLQLHLLGIWGRISLPPVSHQERLSHPTRAGSGANFPPKWLNRLKK